MSSDAESNSIRTAPTVISCSADFLISQKRTEEWNNEIHKTLELDPFNPFFQCFYGWHLVYLKRYEAIAQFQKVLELAPDFSSAHMGLGRVLQKGNAGRSLVRGPEVLFCSARPRG